MHVETDSKVVGVTDWRSRSLRRRDECSGAVSIDQP